MDVALCWALGNGNGVQILEPASERRARGMARGAWGLSISAVFQMPKSRVGVWCPALHQLTVCLCTGLLPTSPAFFFPAKMVNNNEDMHLAFH